MEKNMKIFSIILISITTLSCSSCAYFKSVVLAPPEPIPEEIMEEINQPEPCPPCMTKPKPGNHKPYGYYFDNLRKYCRKIDYSTDGMPPPFKSFAECKECCGHLIKDQTRHSIK